MIKISGNSLEFARLDQIRESRQERYRKIKILAIKNAIASGKLNKLDYVDIRTINDLLTG